MRGRLLWTAAGATLLLVAACTASPSFTPPPSPTLSPSPASSSTPAPSSSPSPWADNATSPVEVMAIDELTATAVAGVPRATSVDESTLPPRPQPSPSPVVEGGASSTPVSSLAPTATYEPSPTMATGQDFLLPLVVLDTGAETVAFNHDSTALVAGTASDGVVVWDTATWQERWSVSHDDRLLKVAFSPDGRRVGSVSFDTTARLWDASSGELVLSLEYDYWVDGMDFSGDSLFWASGSRDGYAKVANTQSGEILGSFKNELPVSDLVLSPNGPWLAVMTAGSWGPVELAVWDIRTHERRTLDRYEGPPCHSNVEFSPDTNWVAAAMSSGSPIQVWQTGTWPQVGRLEIPGGCVRQVTFSDDGRRIAAIVSGTEERDSVLVWEAGTWKPVSEMHLADVVWNVDLSTDGRWLLAGLGQGIEHPPANEGQLWSTDEGQLILRMPHSRQVLTVAFSRDGAFMATGSYDAIKIWPMIASD